MDQLNLNQLWKELQCNRFCKKKVKEIKMKPDPNFILDENSILRKAVKLKYSVEPTIVVPRKINKYYYFRDSRWERPLGNQLYCQHDAKIFLVD